MKITVKNKKTNRTFDVDTVANDKLENKSLEAEVKDAEEKVEEKVEEEKVEEKVELTPEEIASLKELASLIPGIKKLLESKEEEKEAESEEEKEEEAEEESEAEESEESEEEEEIEESEEVIIEEPEEEFSEIDEEAEEDVIEDECGSDEIHDSKASIGSIEVDDSVKDSSTRELEVANAFDSRYKKALNK